MLSSFDLQAPVTVTPTSSRFASAWLPVQETADELRDECSTLDNIVQDLFADVDLLRAELEAKADELAAAEQRLAERSRQLDEQRQERGRLTHQLDEQAARLEAALNELRELRTEFANEQLLARQRQAEQPELNVIPRIEPSEFADPILSELSALREQILEVQMEVSGALERVVTNTTNAPPAMDTAAVEHFADFKQEKAELENELDLVRTRAAELHETVADQKRELESCHTGMAAELKELQRLVQQQADLLQQRDIAGANDDAPKPEKAAGISTPPLSKSQPAAAEEVAKAAPAATADPVVNSVMAQFAKLQKDVAQRRKKK